MAGYNRTLGKSLEAALRATQRAPVELTHQQRVTRLYRDALRTLDSWISDRAIWCDQTNKVRAQFDKYKHYPADSGYVLCVCVGHLVVVVVVVVLLFVAVYV